MHYQEEILTKVDLLNLKDLNKAVGKIKITEKSSNPTILTLECDVQIVVMYLNHFFTKYI